MEMASSQLETNPALMKVSDTRGELPQRHPRNKKSTKEKIDKLVADGAKNYPAYLKLIYTGDSELSSEDEFCADHKAKLSARRGQAPKSNPELDYAAAVNAPAVFSPESTKLLDPGCEKLPTPVDQNSPLKQDLHRIHDDHTCGKVDFSFCIKYATFKSVSLANSLGLRYWCCFFVTGRSCLRMYVCVRYTHVYVYLYSAIKTS